MAVIGFGLAGASGLGACDSEPGDAAAIPAGAAAASGDPGHLQRIDAPEYARSIQRSLGVELSNEDRLSLVGHDAEFTADDYQRHFDRVQLLVSSVFADPALRARIVTCAPSSAEDSGCTQTIIRQFGAVAWQRPVSDAEVSDLQAVAASAASLGNDFPQSVAEVIKAMMVSVRFLYRVQGVCAK